MNPENELMTSHAGDYLEDFIDETEREAEQVERALLALNQIITRSGNNRNFLDAHKVEQVLAGTCEGFDDWQDIDYVFGDTWRDEEQELYQKFINDSVNTSDIQELVGHLEQVLSGQENLISGVKGEKNYVEQRSSELEELYSRISDADTCPTGAIYDLEQIVDERNTETEPLVDGFRDARDIVYADFDVEGVSDTNYPVLRDSVFLLYQIDTEFEADTKSSPNLGVESIGI